MAILTLERFGELAEPILTEVFFAGFDRDANAAPSVLSLFGIMNSNKRYEYALSLGGAGLFEKRYEGGPVNYDTMEQLFKTTFETDEFQKSIAVDRMMIEDQDFLGIRQIAENMGMNASRTMRQHAANIFNNAFSSSYLGGDSKALCAADHPLDKDAAATGDNLGSTALSYDAVKAARIEMRKFKDARNKPIAVVPDTLVVGVDLEETANAIAASINKPGTGNNDANFFKGLNVISDPYISSSTDWFLVDSVQAKSQLLMFSRIPLTYSLATDNAREPNYVQAARMRYDMGWSDWRFVYGSDV